MSVTQMGSPGKTRTGLCVASKTNKSYLAPRKSDICAYGVNCLIMSVWSSLTVVSEEPAAEKDPQRKKTLIVSHS